MPKTKTPVQKAFDDLVKQAVTAVLKPMGFKKTALNFHRRQNEVVQVVNIQGSLGSTSVEKVFYVNVGFAFDEICNLNKISILEKPRVHDCDLRGYRSRLENFVTDAPDRFSITDMNIKSVRNLLKAYFVQLGEEFDKIQSVKNFREHRWFNVTRPSQVTLQSLYLVEGIDAASVELNALTKLFSDRPKLNDPNWWIEELNLEELSSKY